jgi:hypothetical protein
MVEYTVRKLINKFLGKYVETGLDISIAAFSGKAELKNVNLKPDIFE